VAGANPEHISPAGAAGKLDHTPVVKNPTAWRQFKAILRKDISMELRTREMVTSMGLYTLLTMVVYFIALQGVIAQGGGTSAFDIKPIAPGLLWAAFIFMSLLGLNRSFVHEKDQGVLDALLLSPVDRPVIYFAKMIGNLIFMLIVEVLAVPVFYFLFLQGTTGLDANLWMLGLALIGGSVGIAGLGTLLATLTVNTKGQDFLLTVLMVPTMFPLLFGTVTASNIALLQASSAAGTYWGAMAFVGGFDAIMLLAAFGLYEFVIGA
jgi:heme exporter protein B